MLDAVRPFLLQRNVRAQSRTVLGSLPRKNMIFLASGDNVKQYHMLQGFYKTGPSINQVKSTGTVTVSTLMMSRFQTVLGQDFQRQPGVISEKGAKPLVSE
jgi:hypothetical protein